VFGSAGNPVWDKKERKGGGGRRKALKSSKGGGKKELQIRLGGEKHKKKKPGKQTLL